MLARVYAGLTPGRVFLALFAGSLGGTRNQSDFLRQRDAVRTEILGLDERVTLYPGHGPATTVGEEKVNNPYFAAI